jgi:hypothetical protein
MRGRRTALIVHAADLPDDGGAGAGGGLGQRRGDVWLSRLVEGPEADGWRLVEAPSMRAPKGAKVTLARRKVGKDAEGRPNVDAVIKVKVGKKSVTRALHDAVGAKLGRVWWRADGKQVAVEVKTDAHPDASESTDTLVALISLP